MIVEFFQERKRFAPTCRRSVAASAHLPDMPQVNQGDGNRLLLVEPTIEIETHFLETRGMNEAMLDWLVISPPLLILHPLLEQG